jgi:Ca2+-binding EF-hand superfamily protein
VNNTGRILYTEFLAPTLEAQGNVAQSKITEAFYHFDRGSKGYIDKDDLRKVLPRTMTDREIDALITEAGADSGGRVSLEQFRQALTFETRRKMSRIYEGPAK